MTVLKRESFASLDIRTKKTVLTYLHPSDAETIQILARVVAAPIAGGGKYRGELCIDNVVLAPYSDINVPTGQTRAVFQTRTVILEPGELLTAHITGLPGDSAVPIESVLMDSTPADQAGVDAAVGAIADAVGLGSGAVEVDHDYGGADRLAYRDDDGRGIDNATVLAFLQSDYAAGRKTAGYAKGTTNTNVHGRWTRPMMLDPATYVLYYYKQQQFGPDVTTVVVS